MFTEWDPTAPGDMEALRSVFDTNGDGKLTAADAGFASFHVLVTQADGSTQVRTLAELGITEINLSADATNIVSPDGSVITGQSTFVQNGVTKTVTNTTLVAEADGHRVVETVSTDGDGNRVVVSMGFDAGGGLVDKCGANTAGNLAIDRTFKRFRWSDPDRDGSGQEIQ